MSYNRLAARAIEVANQALRASGDADVHARRLQEIIDAYGVKTLVTKRFANGLRRIAILDANGDTVAEYTEAAPQ